MFLFTALFFSCSDYQVVYEPFETTESINIVVSVPDFVSADKTKSHIASGAFVWDEGDRIGLFSNNIKDNLTQSPSQLALTLSSGEGAGAFFSGRAGWTLVPGGGFNYFSYYPFSESNSRVRISINYTGQAQTTNDNTSNLGAFDYLYSDMVTPAFNETSALFSFHHFGAMVNIKIQVPPEYENTTFYSMKLMADSDIFTTSATYSVESVASSGRPSPVCQMGQRIKLSFGDSGVKPTDGVISTWLMMFPAQWKDLTVKAQLYSAKNDVPTISGDFTPSSNQTAGILYEHVVHTSATGQILPDKPDSGELLHILLLGHSFGANCIDFLPYMLKAANIQDVHLGYFYQGNCSLQQHWEHIENMDTYRYGNNLPSSGAWDPDFQQRRVYDVLCEFPWDIIIFQQSIGFDGEGNYSSYQPHLNYLRNYVTDVCTEVHGKTPVIGWNMFWGYNSSWATDYDRDATLMYQSIVNAALDMMNDTPIRLIIPSGTAMQNARGTSLNDPGSPENPSTTHLFTADGYHASNGIGCYVTACSWFQRLIAPIYGVDITGNTYRPSRYSFEGDQVTDAAATILQKCAVEAVNHPFEVTPIEE